jgi:glycerol uptake facilitator-like aquaporin
MDSKLRSFLAELIGTFLVVVVGAGTVCASALSSPPLPVTAAALAEGLTLAAVLTVTFLVSPGCLNPAITVMLWVLRRLNTGRAAALVLAQLLGGVLAGLVLRLMFATRVLADMKMGAPYLKAFNPDNVPLAAPQLFSGMAFELLLTCVIALAVFATLFDRRGPRVGGLIVGLAQTAVVLFGYRLTGGSANPARWFGPVVWEATVAGATRPHGLGEAVIYAGGPILGALLGAVLYVNLILPPSGDQRSEVRGQRSASPPGG